MNNEVDMKKILFTLFITLSLTACSDKNQYEQAVLAQMQKESDIKDYKITPEYMTKCVVDTTAENMPGIFRFDPNRLMAYRNYTKMLTLTMPTDPKQPGDFKKSLEQLRDEFGSVKALADARANYAESLTECYSAVISKTEDAAKAEKAVEPAKSSAAD